MDPDVVCDPTGKENVSHNKPAANGAILRRGAYTCRQIISHINLSNKGAPHFYQKESATVNKQFRLVVMISSQQLGSIAR
jgi:hypothetical protein